MNWDELWAARIGEKLDSREVSVWEEEIQTEIKDLLPGEVLAAVRAIANDKRTGQIKYKPTLNHIISAIIRNRYQAKRGPAMQVCETRSEQRMNEAKAQIRRAPDRITRWNLICDLGQSLDECTELHDFAIAHLGFVKPTWAEMGWEPMESVMRRIGATIQRVTDDIATPHDWQHPQPMAV